MRDDFEHWADGDNDLAEAIELARKARLGSGGLREAFKQLSEALYWAYIPSPGDRFVVRDRLHAMHVAVHQFGGTPPEEPNG